MKVRACAGRDDIATVYIAEMSGGRMVEFLESVQPPLPREKKWVLIISSLFGCPVRCPICDAGGDYRGKLSVDEILAQTDFLVYRRFADGHVPVDKFKIQFARMGDPALNGAVLDALEILPRRYRAPGLMPCLSTVAPAGYERFFERLLEIKNRCYPGRFQLQFSIHTTDQAARDRLIPIEKWDLTAIARYGERFHATGDRKITLNFALIADTPVDPAVLLDQFDPDHFLIKITPLNPTCRTVANQLVSYIDTDRTDDCYPVVRALRAAGYDVIVSIGELTENSIGSNCGQYVSAYLKEKAALGETYSYEVREYAGAQ